MLLAMTLTVSTSTVAGAKSGVADAAKEARDAFANGEQAFAADDYELGLHHFRTAMELAPHDAVRFNLAVCFERLGRFREAVEEYAAAARSPQLDRAQACAREPTSLERLGTFFEAPAGARRSSTAP